MKKIILAVALAVTAAASGVAYAEFAPQRTPVEFYFGHTHDDGVIQGAPQHSGRTDRNGCHNASVPYHCH